MSGHSEKADERKLFGEGWLDEQLAEVVGELAGRNKVDQPRLTGARAAAMSDPAWLAPHKA